MGVLALDIFVDTLVTIVEEQDVPASSYIFLMDRNKGIVNHPNADYGYIDDEPVSLSNLPGNPYGTLVNALDVGTKEIVSLKDYDGNLRSFFTHSVESCNWNVVVAISNNVVKIRTVSLLGGFWAALVISVIICVVVTIIVAKRIVAPIERLTKIINSSDFSQDIKVESKNQIVSAMDIQYEGISSGKKHLEDFDGIIKNLKNNFQIMEKQVQNVLGLLGNSAKVAENLESSTKESVDNINNIFDDVKELETISDSITQIVSTISNISSQTSLLSPT